MKRFFLTVLTFLGLMFSAPTANAALIITMSQVGNNVVSNGSGDLNITALTTLVNLSGWNDPASIDTSVGTTTYFATPFIGTVKTNMLDFGPAQIIGPSNIGATATANASSSSGDVFGFAGNRILFLPQNYVSGTNLSFQTIWNNHTLASLGIVPGTYTWNWGSGANADFFRVDAISCSSQNLI